MDNLLDAKWYPELSKGSVEVLHHLKGSPAFIESQKRSFLGGETVCPLFDYSHIDLEELSRKEKILLRLEKAIDADTTTLQVVKELYYAKIREFVVNIKLVRSARAMSAASSEALPEHAKIFEESNRFLYGNQNRDIFRYGLFRLQVALGKVSDSVRSSYSVEYEKLYALVKDLTDQPPTYSFVRSLTTPERGEVVHDVSVIARMFETSLQAYGLHETWKVDIDTTGVRTTFSVIAHTRTIAIPGQSYFDSAYERGSYYTSARIQGLIAHEIGTHAIRRKNGHESKLRLLGLGLDRFRRGDEGIATYRAQQENGSEHFTGFLSNLAIGLAGGLEPGGVRKNFAEVHELLTSYFIVVRECAVEAARIQAWDFCWRIFRGTPCGLRGVVFSKDLFYSEGNVFVHQLLGAYPNAARDFDIGNFDPLKKHHVEALLSLAMLPRDPWSEIVERYLPKIIRPEE